MPSQHNQVAPAQNSKAYTKSAWEVRSLLPQMCSLWLRGPGIGTGNGSFHQGVETPRLWQTPQMHGMPKPVFDSLLFHQPVVHATQTVCEYRVA